MAELKKNWTLNQDAFRQVLTWLDAGVDSDGQSFLEMRRRLVLYFDRKNCAAPDDLADETLNRVARKLEEKGEITDVSPAHYCYITAKFVFLESIRADKHVDKTVEALPEAGVKLSGLATPDRLEADEGREKSLDCLERCLPRLQFQDRELILEYYQGEKREKIKRRNHLAARFGFTMNALSIRACRIRNKLEVCVRKCCEEG